MTVFPPPLPLVPPLPPFCRFHDDDDDDNNNNNNIPVPFLSVWGTSLMRIVFHLLGEKFLRQESIREAEIENFTLL